MVILDSSLLPFFGVIVDIFVYQVDITYFIVEEYTTHCFLQHFHSFEVSATSPPLYRTCQINDFADYHPLCIYTTSGNTKLIPLKYMYLNNFEHYLSG